MVACRDPGKLNKRVTIQVSTEPQDTTGEPIPDWSNVATVWASVEPIGGNEFFEAGYWASEVSHRITMRYRSGVTTKHRILYDSRAFNIKRPRNIEEANVWLELFCVEKID